MIDLGSEVNLIETSLVDVLRTSRRKCRTTIKLIGGQLSQTARESVTVTLVCRDQRRMVLTAMVLPCLGLSTPPKDLRKADWPHLEDLDLADPAFRTPERVEILLGVEVFAKIILDGIRRQKEEAPIALSTRLGWLVFGSAGNSTREGNPMTFANVNLLADLEGTLKRFWELEEPLRLVGQSKCEEDLENLFMEGVNRNTAGRYIVHLPFKASRPTNLRSTIGVARSSLARIRKEMARNPKLASAYHSFMKEYQDLNHLEQIPRECIENESEYCYLPHHGIWQKADNGEKLRVVFNASCKPRYGPSLNEQLHVGSQQQQLELIRVITLWRLYKIVFGADIRHMFRQILVAEEDRDYQRILWFNEEDGSELHLRLLTVTYGMSCAPYLALRVLKKLVQDEGQHYPRASQLIEKTKYVDDIFGGADTVSEAVGLREELIALLKAGGFPLSKWISNDRGVTEGIPTEQLLRPGWRQLNEENPVMTLGLAWDPIQDEFRYRTPKIEIGNLITKRTILTAIARLFDPMGWVSPVVIVAKVIMQDLWRNKRGWDDRLPRDVMDRWNRFADSFTSINKIIIPRWLDTHSADQLRLYGFSDASQKAYAACVYVQGFKAREGGPIHLVLAKTRVAPVKTQTVPRLELCAAVLLAELLQRVALWLGDLVKEIHAWTDSSITLAWLEADPSRWPIFVANRVAQVQRSLPGVTWNYVPSEENPADIASRGTTPDQLLHATLWWNGPHWLKGKKTEWPKLSQCNIVTGVTLQEEVPAKTLADGARDFTEYSSNLTNLLRAIARGRRWIRLARPHLGLVSEPLTVRDLSEAFEACTRYVQTRNFKDELRALEQKKKIGCRSPLHNLNPFLDSNKLIRVGGRLDDAPLPYDQRHPIIIPKRSWLAHLLIDQAHRAALHGGPSVTYAYAMRKAWIVGGRGLCKSHVRNCVRCTRATARPQQQLMGSLPAARVTPGEVFDKVGLDYAGPFYLKASKGRGIATTKGYLAIFVCMKIKAVHLELVGDLTTPSFIAALNRFADRRGAPTEIWSDNATTFHCADKELGAMFAEAKLEWSTIDKTLVNKGIQWKFIPPGAPHFGGLWEAAVKSAKSHLKRIINQRHLTYEELSTLACQVEAILNSRPLVPVDGTTDDLQVLTPQDFLTTTRVQWPREQRVEDEAMERLTHWRLIKAMRNHFWSRWSREYLHTLQQRIKWKVERRDVGLDDVVLILDPSLLNLGRWPLGRVTQVHPGRDGRTRVVTVRTQKGNYTRPITKICRLPVREVTKQPHLDSAQGGRDV